MVPTMVGEGGTSVILLVLIGVLALVVGGCACVVWAARGGPPWVRVVARATLLGGGAVRRAPRGGRASHGEPAQGGDG
ncbi:hypothetical protein GCM10022244_51700 [Streptomyces gulbargensis]|uniref:Uncharacterized protein n=1 Tax=Streptomyces gulbargensis TaxID=364901 RepID=A0ABP7N6S8_9ACTN